LACHHSLFVKYDYRFSMIIFGTSGEKHAMFLQGKSAQINIKNRGLCDGYLIVVRFGLRDGAKEL
jgi:hypothetical protein